MKIKQIVAVSTLAVVLVGCGVATVISIIDSALPIAIQLAGGIGVLPAGAVAPINAALDCIDKASAELASGDSAAQKSASITASCLGSASLALPPGSPQQYVTLAQKLATYIQTLLATLPPVPVASPNLRASKPVKDTFPALTQAQKDHLLEVSARAKAAKRK